jgi:hypothetical protein
MSTKIDWSKSFRLIVFGPGFGESIVLYLPTLGWGVVDSCLNPYKNGQINPALSFLIDNGVDKLAFAILTHPHEDHYKGFDSIIDHYIGRIDRIGLYAGDGLREYRDYLSCKAVVGDPDSELDHLAAIYRKARDAEMAGARRIRLSEKTVFFSNKNVSIEALSPSSNSQEKYRNILFDAIPKNDGDLISSLKHRDINLISVALLVTVGNTKILLGGDVENGDGTTGWSAILNDQDCPDMNSHFVKVPHHGSEGAFSCNLWSCISQTNEAFSIVTPYTRLSSPLPSESILSNISEYSQGVAITQKHRLLKPKHYYSRTTIKNLAFVKSWGCLEKDIEIGSIDIVGSIETGEIINANITEPAFIYEPSKPDEAPAS